MSLRSAYRRSSGIAFLLILLLPVAPAARAAPTCTTASGAILSFGIVVPLASSGNITSNTGASFWINCSADVLDAPSIYSTSDRVMQNGASQLPFTLSAAAPGGLPLPMTAPGEAAAIPLDGTNRTVTLHGRILSSDFKGLPAGNYSQNVTITIAY